MKFTSMSRRVRGATVAAALVGGMALFSAPSASAVDCSTAWQNRDAGSNSLNQGAPIRSGPHQGCTNKYSQSGTSSAVHLDCWTRNTAGNVWWHVKHLGTGTRGWVYEPNLYYTVVRHASNRCLA